MTNTPTPHHCLWCHAPLEHSASTQLVCPLCGKSNSKADLRIYWTRERRLVELEHLLKVFIVLLTVLLMPLACMRSTGPGSGGLAALPIAFGWVLWQITGKLTRHQPDFRPRIVATAAFGGMAAVLLLAAVLSGALAVYVLALVLLAGAALTAPIATRLGRWKRDKLLAGERALEEAQRQRARERREHLLRIARGDASQPA